MMSRGSGPQMLMIDLHYRFGQHGDFGVASALGVVSYLLASGAAYYYLLLADGVAVSARAADALAPAAARYPGLLARPGPPGGLPQVLGPHHPRRPVRRAGTGHDQRRT